jgi:hypothetical protein
MDNLFSPKFFKALVIIAVIGGILMLVESQFVYRNSKQYLILKDSITIFYKEKNQNIQYGFFVIGDLNILDETDSTYKSKLYFKIYDDIEKKSVVGIVYNKKETSIYTIQSIEYGE